MMTQSADPAVRPLYERLGGAQGLRALASNVVDAHIANPAIGPRFAPHDAARMKQLAYEFFASGTGGPETYTGRDLPAAHRGMNASEQEFVAIVDDVMAVLARQGIGQQEQREVLSIFWSLKDEVVRL